MISKVVLSSLAITAVLVLHFTRSHRMITDASFGKTKRNTLLASFALESVLVAILALLSSSLRSDTLDLLLVICLFSIVIVTSATEIIIGLIAAVTCNYRLGGFSFSSFVLVPTSVVLFTFFDWIGIEYLIRNADPYCNLFMSLLIAHCCLIEVYSALIFYSLQEEAFLFLKKR